MSIRPSASSSAAITPTDFWASLAPWLKASAADIPHWPPRTGALPAARGTSGGRRIPRITNKAPSAPRGGEDRECDQGAEHADRVPAVEAAPIDGIDPALDQGSAHQSADQGMARARREPPRQVSRFQAPAAASPAPITSVATDGATVTIPPIVSATAAPTNSGPRRLKTDARTIA